MIEDSKEFDRKRLQELLDLMAEDRLLAEDEAELQTILKSSKAARRLYLEFTSMLDAMHWAYAESGITESGDKEKETPAPVKFYYNIFAVAAAVLIIGLSLFIFYNSGRKDTVGEFFADAASIIDRKQKSGRIGTGTVSVKKGSMRILFDSGAMLNVTGPAEIDVLSSLHVILKSGKARVKAPNSAMGFRLQTQASDFVDIGTEFEVTVNEDNAAHIEVIDGIVIARPKRGEMVVPFGKNEAGVIDPVYGDIVSVEPKIEQEDFLSPKGSKFSPLPNGSRVIFLGDRNTDFETYLHMVNQAVYDAGKTPPVLLNAGMTCRLYFEEPDFKDLVLDLNPTHAVLAFGAEIASNHGRNLIHRIEPGEFKRIINRMCDRLEKAGVQPIIMTGYPVYSIDPSSNQLLEQYNRILSNLADKRNYRLTEADKIYSLYTLSEKSKLVDVDNVYPTYEGHRLLARSILDVLGYGDLKVPHKLRFRTMPGIINNWKINNEFSRDTEVDEALVKSLNSELWDDLILPQPAFDDLSRRMVVPHQNYPAQARSLGVAMGITPDWRKKSLAMSEYYSDEEKLSYINLGGDIHALWVNGQPVRRKLEGIYSVGRHVGIYRIPVKLKKGKNKILVEAVNSFFLSITANKDWGLQPPAPK